MKHHETLAIRCDDISLDAETLALGSDMALGAVTSRSVQRHHARRSDIGARAEFLATLARSFRRYRRLRSWYNSADV